MDFDSGNAQDGSEILLSHCSDLLRRNSDPNPELDFGERGFFQGPYMKRSFKNLGDINLLASHWGR